jgi:hypothetical protein
MTTSIWATKTDNTKVKIGKFESFDSVSINRAVKLCSSDADIRSVEIVKD